MSRRSFRMSRRSSRSSFTSCRISWAPAGATSATITAPLSNAVVHVFMPCPPLLRDGHLNGWTRAPGRAFTRQSILISSSVLPLAPAPHIKKVTDRPDHDDEAPQRTDHHLPLAARRAHCGLHLHPRPPA